MIYCVDRFLREKYERFINPPEEESTSYTTPVGSGGTQLIPPSVGSTVCFRRRIRDNVYEMIEGVVSEKHTTSSNKVNLVITTRSGQIFKEWSFTKGFRED